MPASTVAHQTRLGQFKQGDPNQGATLTAPNKVLFSLSVPDAEELGLEFAVKPPTETRLEEQYIISQNPVYDLLHGHKNAEIREFVNTHIRPLKERLDEIYGESESERLIRMELMDEASLLRIGQQIETEVNRGRWGARTGLLLEAKQAITQAGRQTDKLKTLNEERWRKSSTPSCRIFRSRSRSA